MKRLYEILAEKVTKDTLVAVLILALAGYMVYSNNQNTKDFNKTANNHIEHYEETVEKFNETILEVSQKDNEVARQVVEALNNVAKTNIALEATILRQGR